ncbi:MAG: hypothetical protein AAGG75_19350, partial [Bacteroidota bacterium]
MNTIFTRSDFGRVWKSKTAMLLVLALFVVQAVSAQVFFTESFEAAVGTGGSGGDCSCVSAPFDIIDNLDDYFARTDGSTIEANFSNPAGYSGQNGTFYWAGEDHNDGGVAGSGNSELSMELLGINITGKTGLKFNALFAANDINNAYDPPGSTGTIIADFVRVEYRIDGGSYTTGLQFSYYTADGGTTEYLKFDTDFNGIGDAGGAVDTLYEVFQPYDFLIPGTGSTLDIRITANSEASAEEWAVDYIQIEENVTSSPCPTVGMVSASSMQVCQNDPFDLTATGLADMAMADNTDQDFGIRFVAFTSAPADPYAGGTDLGTVAFGSLTAGNTTAALVGATLATPGAYTIYAVLSPTPTDMSCRPSASTTVTIGEDLVVSFTALADLCIDAGVQLSLSGGSIASPVSASPTMQSYSGPGVTDNGNGTYSFDPAAAGVGTHTITYTVTADNGCTGTAMDDVEVFALPNATFTALADLCIDAGVQVSLGGGSPASSVASPIYSGPGVTDNGDDTYDFDPAAAGVGTHTITFTYTDATTGCTATAMDDVEVFALPIVIVEFGGVFCEGDPSTTITPFVSPTGGTFSGPGVTDNGDDTFTFDPSASGVGRITVTYTVTDMNGCVNSEPGFIDVSEGLTLNFTALADLCISDGVQLSLAGGSIASPIGASPTMQSLSGPGVTDNGDNTYDFDPAAAGVGVHTITYTVTADNGCSAMASDDVEVFASPTVTFTAPADLCIDAGVQMSLSGGMPASSAMTTGIYSGPGVTDNGDGTYDFDPMAAGVGVHTITYDFTDANGCTGTASDDVEVFTAPAVSLSTAEYYCLDASMQGVPLIGGSPAGGVYSGTGVTDLGNGMNYNFDPTVAGTGPVQIFYTITIGGCSATDTSTLTVFDCDFDMTDPCFCLNNASTIDLDNGTGGGDGQFSEVVSVIDNAGAPLPAGQTWTVVGQTGALDAYNIPAVGMQSAGVPVATDGSVTLTYNALLGTYELPFVHAEDIGYTIMIEGPFGQGSPVNQTIMIGNTCDYPNPTFDPALQPVYCAADPAVTLGAIDLNGNGADAIFFFIDGTPSPMLDPGALTPGPHTVVVTFNGADDGNGGMGTVANPASPGCIQNAQQIIEVLAGAPPTIDCPADNFGLPMGCNVTVPAPATTFNMAGTTAPDPALPTITAGCGTVTLSSFDMT